MNWINTLNTVSCMVLLGYLMGPAILATKLRHRLSLWPLAAVIGLQLVDPTVAWIPDLAWPSVALNVALVITVTIYRKQLWELIKAEFT